MLSALRGVMKRKKNKIALNKIINVNFDYILNERNVVHFIDIMKREKNKNPVQPVSGTKVPRFAGPSTFARLPELRDVESCDVAIVGIPFDAGTSYRPGARFGPMSIRQASRHLRTNYHPSYDVEPFKVQQVADAGDITL